MALFLIPKGTSLHELLHLPVYWWRVTISPKQVMQMERIAYGPHPRQYYLMYRGIGSPERIDKVLVYFHGGAWRFGRPEMFSLVASVFVSHGYTVVLPSCRRTPRFAYPDIRDDLTTLMVNIDQQFQPHQPAYLLGGMSSGGNLAAHLFYDLAPLEKAGFGVNRIKALLLLGAPLDLHQMPNNPLVTAFAGPFNSEQFSQASIPTYLTAKQQRPVLCIQGQQDGLVPYASAVEFIAALEKVQEEGISFHLLPQITHLETASWTCGDHSLKRIIFKWLDRQPIFDDFTNH